MDTQDAPTTESSTSSQTTQTEDLLLKGWTSYVNSDFVSAEASFRQLILIDTRSIEAYYALGLSLKAQNRKDDAIEAFNKAVSLLQDKSLSPNSTRASMLGHLATAHLSYLFNGEWNMKEKE
jgi:tetratricopeptide (TPR) repeat protein